MTILEVKDVSVIYSDDKRVAVEHASFKIEAGEYACIIGSNGSGKSTLVKGIVGLVPITSGQVIHQLSPEQYAYLSQITYRIWQITGLIIFQAVRSSVCSWHGHCAGNRSF